MISIIKYCEANHNSKQATVYIKIDSFKLCQINTSAHITLFRKFSFDEIFQGNKSKAYQHKK